MDRPDLIAAFTKIELWRQTQYKKLVYLDADVVALRAPDELLTLDKDFSAVPDIGWPDCFNTGVMVLKPNMEDYYSLLALAQRGISFDGADQGLLNMHFKDWHRLSFTYNCTPSGNYQYLPAYKHFGSTISMVHYIGQQKPWSMERQGTRYGGPYSELLGRWWEVYDRHYRPSVDTVVKGHSKSYSYAHYTTHEPEDGYNLHVPEQGQRQESTRSEFQKIDHSYHTEAPAATRDADNLQQKHNHREKEDVYIPGSVVPQYVHGEQHIAGHQHHHVGLPQPSKSYDEPIYQSKSPETQQTQPSTRSEQFQHKETVQTAQDHKEPIPDTTPEQRARSPPMVEWDASRYV